MPTLPTKVGYIFDGWYTDDTTFQNAFTEKTAVTADVTVYAKWAAIPGHVVNIKTANSLLVGKYAFSSDNESYTLNNYLKAAQTAYHTGTDEAQYHIYYYTGSAWYDLVTDPTLTHPIANNDLNTINGNGMYQFENTKDILPK